MITKRDLECEIKEIELEIKDHETAIQNLNNIRKRKQEQKQQLHRFLNLHYLGDIHCNELDENGHFVSKYPEKETKEFKDAMWRSQTTFEFEVKLVYDVNCNCKLELL